MAAWTLATDASLSGTVQDPAGVLVVNETVVVTNPATRQKIKVKTGERGKFGPVLLQEGEYKVEIRAKCYKPYKNVIKLADSRALYLDVKLVLSCPKDMRVE